MDREDEKDLKLLAEEEKDSENEERSECADCE